MSLLDAATILAIAFGLAMDAFSVSIAYGITTKAKAKTTPSKWLLLWSLLSLHASSGMAHGL